MVAINGKGVLVKIDPLSHDMGNLEREIRMYFQQSNRWNCLDVTKMSVELEGIFARYGFRDLLYSPRVRHAKQILVLRLDEVGDLVLTTPFLRELRRNFPEANITLVVKSHVYNLMEECPYINHIVAVNGMDIDVSNGRVLDEFLRICRDMLWRQRYDLCIMPRFDVDLNGACLLGFLSGAAVRIGYSEVVTPWKKARNQGYDSLFTHVLSGKCETHEVERNLDVLRRLSLSIEEDNLELWTDLEDEKFAAGEFVEPAAKRIVFAPGKAANSRAWPTDRYIALGKKLIEEYDADIVVVGSLSERDACSIIEQALPGRVKNFAGRTTLRQVVALLRFCDIYVGRDTGIMHMANAVGIPVVEVSCHPKQGIRDHGYSPVRFRPWQGVSAVLQPLECSVPCQGRCQQNYAHCILQISVEAVKAAADSIMGTHRNKL